MTTPRRNSRTSYCGDSNPLNNILNDIRSNKNGGPSSSSSSSTLSAAKKEPMDILSDCKLISKDDIDGMYKVLIDIEENQDKIGTTSTTINYHH
jgi:hypothetical protein